MNMMWTWTPVWERIYRFNTVLEYLDKVIQTTEAIRNQVEGEARFGRAYYHFMLLTQYCLWGDDKPGIGYRDNTTTGEVPGRETVAYTLEHIYEDLRLAEEALIKAGRTTFRILLQVVRIFCILLSVPGSLRTLHLSFSPDPVHSRRFLP